MANRSSVEGYSLIEILIALAIVGMLAAFAMPSYQAHIVKTHRSDGKAALVELANRMDSYFLDNLAYPATVSEVRSSDFSEEGLYKLSIANRTNASYVVIATALNQQAIADPDCIILAMDSTGSTGTLGGTAVAAAPSCW